MSTSDAPDQAGPLSWLHPEPTIPERGLDLTREADADERAAVAAALELVSVDRLAARYRIRRLPRGRLEVAGTLEAQVQQRCVITLEPLPSAISEEFAVELWPADALEERGDAADDPLGPDAPEELGPDGVDIGQLVYEHLAASLDPFPRAPGAALDVTSTERDDAAAARGPFAALGKLRDRRS
ncbi:MAG: DUF177 domain-containing protein [Hyphomicrobiaceae bacterium]|nr:DUF177 domain-containing protein [Hyphomicrobiaceae bacterium]